MRRIRRIAGLGEGAELKKSIELATRHPNVEVVANDLHPHGIKLFRQELAKHGHFEKPSNLTLATNRNAIDFLRAEKPSSFDHIYAHFLMQHMPPGQRTQLYEELKRALRPGGSFKFVEEMHFSDVLRLELQRFGFRVSARRMTTNEVEKIGTPKAIENAEGWREIQKGAKKLEKLQPDFDVSETALDVFNERIRKNNEGPEAQKLIRRHKHVYLSDKPFVLIEAKKGRVRYQ